jgi:hypothetical protein
MYTASILITFTMLLSLLAIHLGVFAGNARQDELMIQIFDFNICMNLNPAILAVQAVPVTGALAAYITDSLFILYFILILSRHVSQFYMSKYDAQLIISYSHEMINVLLCIIIGQGVLYFI